MSVTARADDVFDPHVRSRAATRLHFVPRKRGLLFTRLRQHFSRLAVVVEVDEKGELDGKARVDGALDPGGTRAARILPPRHLLREPADADDVHVAVAVHVDRQIAEAVDV